MDTNVQIASQLIGLWGHRVYPNFSAKFLGGCMNWKRFFVVAFALLAILSIGSGRLAAQTQSTGDVAGVVNDPTGAVVPNAKVGLRDNSKGSIQDSQTDKNGAYHFYLLPPGTYTVTATASGFQAENRTVEVSVGRIADFPFQLAMGTSSTTVTVTESAPMMSADNGNVASTLSETQIANVPN